MSAKISIRGLYKIFGPDAPAMVPKVAQGMDKAALLERHGHVLGLRDVNIDMRAEATTVIMGLSGSGKSTLIRHLNRLVDPTAGEVLVDGVDMMKLGPAELRVQRQRKMSMVFQKFALLPHQSVEQNVAMPLSIRGADERERSRGAGKWIERVGLGRYADRYPAQLSGGMQQRVGIARALAADTDVMLMDEAFSALDPLIRADMQNLLLELQQELRKTIVFITHDLDEALKIADRLVILNNGVVVQQDEPQRILLEPADAYVEDFVGEINRARVLRVRSVMAPADRDGFDGEVSPDASLEQLIAQSDGDTGRVYRVVRGGETVGQIDMKDLVRALVPRRRGAA